MRGAPGLGLQRGGGGGGTQLGRRMVLAFVKADGYGSKLYKELGQTAGFGPCFHLPGFHFGTVFFEPQPDIGWWLPFW